MAETLVLNNENLQWFKAVQNKYTKDFVPFYEALAKEFTAQGGSALKDIIISKNRVEAAIDEIYNLINPTTPTTQTELNKVLAALKKVNSDFNFWLRNAKNDAETNDKLNKVLEKEGLDLDRLSKQQKVIQGRTEKVTSHKTSVWSKFKEFSPELAGGLQGAGKDLLGALGPAGTLGMQAWGIGSKIVKGYKSRKLAAEHKTLAGAIVPSGEETPEGFGSVFNNLRSGGKGPIGDDILGSLKNFIGNQSSRAVGGVGGTDLFTFFNGPMIKTKWSKALFELLESMGGVSKTVKTEKSGFSLGDIITGSIIGETLLAALPLILGVLGTAAAIALLAGFVATTMPALTKAIGSTPAHAVMGGPTAAAGDLASKAAKKFLNSDFVKNNKQKFDAEAEASLTPRMQRIDKILAENPGMTTEEAVRQERAQSSSSSLKTIPVTADSTGSVTKAGLDKLHSAFVDLKEELKSAGKSTVGIKSGYDAWNNRNPNLNYIGLGEADVATA